MAGKLIMQRILGRTRSENGKEPTEHSGIPSQFADKIVDAEQAIDMIKPGDHIFLGTGCATLIHEGHYGVMIASRGEGIEPVPLDQVVRKRKTVPLDHPWIESARLVGTNLGE